MRRSDWRQTVTVTIAIGLLLAIRPVHADVPNITEDRLPPFGHGGDRPVVSVTAELSSSPISGSRHLSIAAKIAPDWHIYSTTQPPGGPLPTKIDLSPSDAFQLVGSFQASSPPDRRAEPAFDNLIIETHHTQVTWRAPLVLAPGVDATRLQIKGTVHVQPCSSSSCLPPQTLPFTATLAKTAPVPAGATGVSETYVQTRQSGDPPAPSELTLDPTQIQITADNELQQTPLRTVLIFGFLGGLLLNLMPCVLPVVGLKILSFVEQAGQRRRQALMLNLWYSFGLISVFLLLASLAVFAGLGWGQLFSFAGFNICLAAVVFVMGLSFLEVWEIPIPGFVGRGRMSDLSAQEGATGAFAKGVLTTLLATPCSGPFLATALTWSVGQPPANTYAVFVSVGIGMASPYLLVGAFPGLLRVLPKPGAWMETFKQAMGFVLLGTVAYLLTLLEWAYVVPTVAFLFGLWAACWWIGRSSVASTTAEKSWAWATATAFVGVVWLITFGWLAGVMTHRFERTLQAASVHSTNVSISDTANQQLLWRPFSRMTFHELIAAQETVMIDCTADWCMTCKTLEKFVLNTPEICNMVRKNGVVAMRADWTHASPEVTQLLGLLGSKQVPVIAIFPAGRANHPIVLRGTYTQQTLLDALENAVHSTSTRVSELQATHGHIRR